MQWPDRKAAPPHPAAEQGALLSVSLSHSGSQHATHFNLKAPNSFGLKPMSIMRWAPESTEAEQEAQREPCT